LLTHSKPVYYIWCISTNTWLTFFLVCPFLTSQQALALNHFSAAEAPFSKAEPHCLAFTCARKPSHNLAFSSKPEVLAGLASQLCGDEDRNVCCIAKCFIIPAPVDIICVWLGRLDPLSGSCEQTA
jgi:hypothetical protein